MRVIHRRVTGFCAIAGSDFAQKAGGARVFAIADQNGAAIAGFGSLSRIVKIRRKPCGAWDLGGGGWDEGGTFTAQDWASFPEY